MILLENRTIVEKLQPFEICDESLAIVPETSGEGGCFQVEAADIYISDDLLKGLFTVLDLVLGKVNGG